MEARARQGVDLDLKVVRRLCVQTRRVNDNVGLVASQRPTSQR